MKNQEVAQLFKNLGTLLEIKGDNIFKIKAYYKAADQIKSLSEDIAVIYQEDRLNEVPGIGQAIKDKIGEYLTVGKVKAFEEVIKEVPQTLLDIVSIPSLGPKKAKLFYDNLKIKDLPGLKENAMNGKILELPGIKEKTIENILKGIRIVEEGQQRMNLGLATKTAEEIIGQLKELKEVKSVSTAGSLRRCCETVGDIDILVASAHPNKVMDAFVHMPQVQSINVQGETKSSVLMDKNVQVDLRVVQADHFGAAQLYFTGSKNFNIKLRQLAQKQNKKVNEYGVYSTKNETEKLLASQTEEECLKELGLPFIIPELREEIGMEKIFAGDTIPQLIEQTDIKGDLHTHSTWSDGKNTIEEMVLAARKRGYQYIGISDHSFGLRVARGVSIEDLVKKKKEIDQLNKKYDDIEILFGSEVEIDKNGQLDYNEQVLSEFDVVIAAVHSGFEQGREQLTNRILSACRNKHVNIIAHPTGIHIGKRESYDIDLKEICKAAVDHNVFLEINAFPIRLDLNSNNVFFAREQGAKFSINTDSHHIDHLNHMRFGIGVARRGWLQKGEVLNTQTFKQLKKTLQK